MKRNLLYLLFFMALISCKKEGQKTPDPVTHVVTPEITFKLEAKYNTGKLGGDVVNLSITGDSVKGVVPVVSNEKSFVVSFSPANVIVKIGDVVQQSGITINDFSKPLTYTFTNAKGEVKTYRVSITNFTGIPIFYLTTAAPVVSKDVYVTGSLSVNTNGQYDQDPASIDLQIKGRGNSTWSMPKKPFKLKFNKKAALLNLPAAKNWVLLANYSDKTLIRNCISLALGRDVASDFAPHTRFVEVVMNGEHLGNYTLTEQVEVNPNRVNIAELTPSNTSAAEITGGYLLEVDERLDAYKYFRSGKGIPFTIQSPDAITDGQLNYIQNYIQQTEDALFSADFADPDKGYAKFINVDSFINWFLVKELVKDNDSKDYSSIYYFKERGGKLGMGPLWDFDLASGNTDYSDCKNATGWWVKNSKWFSRLFQDPAFQAKVKKRWNELKAQAIPAIFTNIDKNAAYINLSQQQNFQKWNIMGIYVWPNAVVLGTYPAEVDYLKSWLQTRVSWMDANM